MTPIDVERVIARQGRALRRRARFAAAACVLIALVTFVVYAAMGRESAGGVTLLPLDDAYIHLRYADQIAHGDLYRYNPDDPPTSGATSFLYPYLLAVGVRLPADPLDAALWSMALGAAAFAASGALIFLIVEALGAGALLASAALLVFMADGAFAWHAMSGMETLLVVLAALAAVYAVIGDHFRLGVIAGVGCALLRPEGAILAWLTALALLIRRLRALPIPSKRTFPPRWAWRREWLWLLLPILAVLVQPTVNVLVTGSWVATGNSAKSLFGMIPPDMGEIARRIAANFLRLWQEYFTPESLFVIVPVMALAAFWLWRRDRLALLMILVWGMTFALAVSTLDTAFWHFKRYQMPLFALRPVLLAAAAAALLRLTAESRARLSGGAGWRRLATRVMPLAVTGGLLGLGVVGALALALSWLNSLGDYLLNVGLVAEQPYAIARDLRAYPDRAARVAVHDVGLIRYLGGLDTLDIVGLTTPGAADYWRNGPGSVGEFIESRRPDLIASYGAGHGLGLGYLAETDLYAEPLATYTVSLNAEQRPRNVALAAETQGIYRPHWATADRADEVALPGLTPYLDGLELVDQIDVADIASERAHDYRWTALRPLNGFPTEYRQFPSIGCLDVEGSPFCVSMDGGRRINGEESFTLAAQPGRDLILVTRVHPGDAGWLTIYASGEPVARRWIPPLPGGWLELPTLIPAERVTAAMQIRIAAETAGDYQPYFHRAYQGSYAARDLPAVLASMQDDAIRLGEAAPSVEVHEDGRRILRVGLPWWTDGRATGDLKRYLHVLNADGVVAAQADGYPARGALPPANWLPGMFIEWVEIDITTLPAGRYRLAVGLYDPFSGERPLPTGESVDSSGRVIVSALDFPP
ncbi:MAG: hypothetical protein JNL42_18670 [Anaerolineae bacterium]|nr:hypothetical protein [Anaerolineae bacterium]